MITALFQLFWLDQDIILKKYGASFCFSILKIIFVTSFVKRVLILIPLAEQHCINSY